MALDLAKRGCATPGRFAIILPVTMYVAYPLRGAGTASSRRAHLARD